MGDILIHNKDLHTAIRMKVYINDSLIQKEEVIGEERQRELFKKESQYEYDKQLQKQQLIKDHHKDKNQCTE